MRENKNTSMTSMTATAVDGFEDPPWNLTQAIVTNNFELVQCLLNEPPPFTRRDMVGALCIAESLPIIDLLLAAGNYDVPGFKLALSCNKYPGVGEHILKRAGAALTS